jgi:hypothetical protein
MTKLTLALALATIHAHAVRCGELLEADPALIKNLAADGQVDPHKDAVAAAKAAGAKVVRSSIELRAAELEATRKRLLVDIALLEEALQKATDAEARAAIEQQLAAKKAALDASPAP